MSRRITVESELIQEVDLAEEVIKELRISSLSFDSQNNCFKNMQYDDIADNTLSKAISLYYAKRRARNIKIVSEQLQKSRYSVDTKTTNNKTKIIGVQRVYA